MKGKPREELEPEYGFREIKQGMHYALSEGARRKVPDGMPRKCGRRVGERKIEKG